MQLDDLSPLELRVRDRLRQEREGRAPKRLNIVYFPNSGLFQVCAEVAEVTEDITWLAKDMLFTMIQRNGVGLAAPQVGHHIRLFVVDIKWARNIRESDPHVFINPVVTPVSEVDADPVKATGQEGCLSFPGASVEVPRYAAVHVRALNLDGKPFEMYADGFLARVIQHESDHLNGVTIAPLLGRLQRQAVQKSVKKALRG